MLPKLATSHRRLSTTATATYSPSAHWYAFGFDHPTDGQQLSRVPPPPYADDVAPVEVVDPNYTLPSQPSSKVIKVTVPRAHPAGDGRNPPPRKRCDLDTRANFATVSI
jgi:hypothetical protein